MIERVFTNAEKAEFFALYRQVISLPKEAEISRGERKHLQEILTRWFSTLNLENERLHPILAILRTILILQNQMGLGKTATLAFLLYRPVNQGVISEKETKGIFSENIIPIISGLNKVEELYRRDVAVESENFRKLLLSFAENLQVILIIIAQRLDTMRFLKFFPEEEQKKIAYEASFLYAPLAHRIGLYAVKTELEDTSLKFTSNEVYKEIAQKLNETKRSRDKYITEFIAPVKKKLEENGFKFEIKGRTKSIHSIWNKIKKQNTPFEKIYDLFAIRVILDCPLEQEKAECWRVYSLVTDMYTPNPKRLRDWLSMPKLNGYESLHTTVMGPQGKWVEVQIRTRRMDEVAEKGFAAHWKYKGIKSEAGMDDWLKNIREILENSDSSAVDFMDNFKLNLYDEEVFAFTPKGDLQRLKKGATLLDFAYNIHSSVGDKCVGGVVNGRHVQLRYKILNGDQVEILTSPQQSPKPDWLHIVATSKARSRIKQALKEAEFKEAEIGREILLRRLKNWKIEYNEADVSRLSKKLGFKTISNFYQAITKEELHLLDLREHLLQAQKKEEPEILTRSAEKFSQQTEFEKLTSSEDVLIIDNDLKGINYTLARCCNPIYGDKIFGFVAVGGGLKVHRADCPNAPQMIARYGYRIVRARWAGKSGTQYLINLKIVGHDDIGIITNITSLISKEEKIAMRSISVDSHYGLFQGTITVSVNELHDLENLIKKINNIKGVKQVLRS